MTTGDRIGLATFIVTVLAAIAAWLVVPGVIPQRREDSDEPSSRKTREVNRPGQGIPHPATIEPTPSKGARYTVQLPTQYTVQAEYCRRGAFLLGTDVTCAASVINNAETDGHAILICGSVNGAYMSTLVDSNGKTYPADRCYLGGHEASYATSFKLSPKIKYRIEINYSGVVPHEDRAALVSFYLDDPTRRAYSADHDEVRFTDIPILK